MINQQEKIYYALARHINWREKWLHANALKNITLFSQDWGRVIGLNLVSDNPSGFDRTFNANTGVPQGDGGHFIQEDKPDKIIAEIIPFLELSK